VPQRGEAPIRRSLLARSAFALLFLALAAECVWFLLHGRFNIDEGMHVNAGRLLFERGLLPYRDFPFSQGPGGPALYGAAGAIFGSSIAVGRAVSLCVNLASVAAMAWFARRVAGHVAALLVVALTLVNLPAIWTYTQVRTEALAVPLVALAAMALCFRKESALQWALAPSLLVWATSIRLTNALALLAVCGFVAWRLRHSRHTLFAAFGVVALNGVIAAAPLIAFPLESWFHIVAAQLGRTERFHMGDYPFSTRFWFFVNPHTSFQPLLALGLLPIAWLLLERARGWRLRDPDVDDPRSVVATLLLLGALTYLPHVLFRIGFFSYFVNASVLLTLAVAIAVPQLAGASRLRTAALATLLGAAWVGGAVAANHHLERWTLRTAPTIGLLDDMTGAIRRAAPGGCSMLTFETYIAVESGCDVLPGLEYSFFSFFPDLPSEDARAHGVLNRAALIEHLERGRPDFVALTADAVEKILNPPPEPTGRTRTLAGERRRLRAEKQAEKAKASTPPVLDAMRGRYVPLLRERVPVGPVHNFWTTVTVYARTELVEPLTPRPNQAE